MNREELLAKALDVLRHNTPFIGGNDAWSIDSDRQQAAIVALEQGRVTEDVVTFFRNQEDREWEIAKDCSGPDPMGFQSEKDRERDMAAAYACEEHYRELADELEKLI